MPTKLDHHGIKQELKDYLKQQSEFTDYNFEGSNLSILLDILAYNTHYNALYANMIINEQFLDSAIKRANVVSLAKHLGYVPRSKTAAGIVADMNVVDEGKTSMTLQRFTEFTGEKEGKQYPFTNMSPMTAYDPDGNFNFNNLELRQGRIISHRFAVEQDDQRFTIPSENVDLTTLSVTVSPVAASEFERYQQGNYFRNYDHNSLIYFVEEDSRGFYTLYFGDGVIGRRVEKGMDVRVTYLVTKGAEGNDISRFTTILSANSIVPSTPGDRSSGGGEKEGIRSIKYSAPRFFSSQGRAITSEDYRSIILSEIDDVESINVWGGDTESPPQYGRVFISIKPKNSDRVSSLLNNAVYRVLRNRGVVSIVPTLVNPDYIYMGFSVNTWYNTKIEANRDTIEHRVLEAIDKFFVENLHKFDADFRYSKFIKAIDNSSAAIESVTVDITLQKRIYAEGSQAVSFSNKMLKGTLKSNKCYFKVYGLTKEGMVVDRDGDLVFEFDNSRHRIGTIDYDTGDVYVDFTDFIGNVESTKSRFYLTGSIDADSRNVNTNRNQILLKDNSEFGVRVVVKEQRLA